MSKINWAEIMETKRDEIELAIKQAKKETEGCMSGWHVNVEIDEDEVWTTELMSCGSQSQSSWNGTSFVVKSMDSWNVEVREDECIRNDEKLYSEFIAQQEDGLEYAHQFIAEKYPEILKEWNDEAIEFEIDETDAGQILDEAIENFKLWDNQN